MTSGAYHTGSDLSYRVNVGAIHISVKYQHLVLRCRSVSHAPPSFCQCAGFVLDPEMPETQIASFSRHFRCYVLADGAGS